MPTQEEIDRAEAAVKKFSSYGDRSHMEPKRQELFQRLCTKEAARLRFFLTKPLSKKARAELVEWEIIFSKSSTITTVPTGLSQTIAPFMGRTLTAYRKGKVQSYRRWPKGKIYERL